MKRDKVYIKNHDIPCAGFQLADKKITSITFTRSFVPFKRLHYCHIEAYLSMGHGEYGGVQGEEVGKVAIQLCS